MVFSPIAPTLLHDIFTRKIKALDLEPIATRLMHHEHGLGWSSEHVMQAIARYKMFLHLMYLYPNRVILPTREIDLVWHFHILDTRKYAVDCEYLFGYFLHHYPSSGSLAEADKAILERYFTETFTLFLKHFGVSLEIHNPRCAFVIKTKDKLQHPSGCPDPRARLISV
jgi:hypothetical protein